MTPIELVLGLVSLSSLGGLLYVVLKKQPAVVQIAPVAPVENTIQPEIKEQPKVDFSQNQLVLEAQTKARELLIEAKDESLKIKRQAEEEVRKIRQEVVELEKRLEQRQENLDRKTLELDRHEQTFHTKEEKITTKLEELDKLAKEQIEKLQSVAGLTKEEARKELISNLEKALSLEV